MVVRYGWFSDGVKLSEVEQGAGPLREFHKAVFQLTDVKVWRVAIRKIWE